MNQHILAPELIELGVALKEAWKRRKTTAPPISSGNVEQILTQLGIAPEIAARCSITLEVLEEAGLPATPEIVVELLQDNLQRQDTAKTQISSTRQSEPTNHPDPFFSAVNYNHKRYGITAHNVTSQPPIIFQDWRNADECRREQYKVIEAWDSQTCRFLSLSEIQSQLCST